MKLRARVTSVALLALALAGSLMANALPSTSLVPAHGLVPVPTVALPRHADGPSDGQPGAASPAHRHTMQVSPAPAPQQIWPPGVNLAPPAQALPGGGCGNVKNTGAPQLQFCCPAVTNSPTAALGTGNEDKKDRTDVSGCPFRVYDGALAPGVNYQFGNPQIAVNPAAEGEVVFTSLHSDADDQGSTPRSRIPSGTHTAFTSVDQGIGWSDQPIGKSPGLAGDGESSAVAIDPKGNTYVAYLWSSAGGNATIGYASTIGLFKASNGKDVHAVRDSYNGGAAIEGRSPTDPIPRVGLVYTPPYVPPPPPANTTGNLTGGPAKSEEIGQVAVGAVNATDARVVAVWFEQSVAAPYGPRGYPGWIDAAVTDTGSKNLWARLPESSLIGPCLDASNPVAFHGHVYVACVVDKGYDHRYGARIGDTDIWAIDPMTGNTTLIDYLPIAGGHPILAATTDGYFALASTRLDGVDGARVMMSYGWYGKAWSAPVDQGRTLHTLAGLQKVYDAQITGLSLSEKYHLAALIYMEWQQPSAATAPEPPAPDPANPTAGMPRLKDYTKVIVVLKECAAEPLAAAKLQLGTGVDATNYAAYASRPSIFDDFQDGLVNYKEASGEDVWYFAVNDYGAIQYGAVRTTSVGSLCPLPPPPLPAPPVPVAQSLSLANPANIAVGATVGVAASAMVLYLLSVKRRAAIAAVAEDK